MFLRYLHIFAYYISHPEVGGKLGYAVEGPSVWSWLCGGLGMRAGLGIRIAGDGLGGRVVVEGLGRDLIWGVYEGCCRRLDGVERLECGRLGGGLRCVVNWVQILGWEVY